MKQVIIVDSKGALKGLEHKGKGIDLKRFGKADVKRITLIEWDSKDCGWYIRWSSQDKFRKKWGSEELLHVVSLLKLKVRVPSRSSKPLLFSSYEDAIAAEVEAVQMLQKQGVM